MGVEGTEGQRLACGGGFLPLLAQRLAGFDITTILDDPLLDKIDTGARA